MSSKTLKFISMSLLAATAALCVVDGSAYFSHQMTIPSTRNQTAQAPSHALTGRAASEALRGYAENSIAALGSTGFVQEVLPSGKRVFFNPSYSGETLIAARDSATSKPYVLGSLMLIPFDLLSQLDGKPDAIEVSSRGNIFTVAHVDTVANGTAINEYEIVGGVIQSKTVRDHIGKKNEISSKTACHYGLDKAAIADLDYANKHVVFGHD